MKHIFHTIQHTARAATVLLLALLAAQTAWAQTDVTDAYDLAEAFKDPTVSVVNVTDNITGVGDLQSLNRALTINLNGHTISGDGLHIEVLDGSLTINGEGQDGSVGNIISGYADWQAIDNSEGTVTLRNVNITTNYDHAIGGPGMLYIGNNVSFNGWTKRPFITPSVNIIEGGNYNYDPGNPRANVVATVTVGGVTHYFENSGAALAYIVNHPDNDDFSLSGDTYTIKSANGWDLFCDMLEAGETFSDKTVKLDANIGTPEDPVNRMGSSTTQFQGTFDGAGHTLTVQYGTPSEPVNQQFVAPFVEVTGGATFRNLTIAGSIYSGYATNGDKGTGGLIGHLFGSVTVEHCVSTVTVNAASDHAGGFVGLCEHAVTFTDCVSSATVTCTGSGSGFVGWSRDSKYTIAFYGCLFSGKVLKQGNVGSGNGSFVGWKGFSKTVTITNCIAAPATDANMATDNSATFCRYSADTTKDNGETHIANCYYTQTLGNAQGKQARAVTAGTDVTVAHAGVATHYATSGITAYKATGASADSDPFIAGLLYNNNVVDVLYAGSDEVVSLTLSNTGAPAGYSFDGYTVSAGTLEGSTLTMPDEDVTVSLALAVLPWTGDGSKGNPYIIYNKDQLDLLAHRVNGTHDETANDYYNTYFKLNNDISYPHTSDWDDAECEQESNYEAIGGYYGAPRYFRGHFDGNNKTISGIRIYKDGTDYADYYHGIFGRTDSGADIHDLTLADTRITGCQYTGGIVGFNEFGTVTGCHVAADVAVCAVQRNAWRHGGIVGGNNWGTIEQCTSAATLTTADADNSYYYGGIAGIIDNGTLSDNLAIGATVPATKGNSYGAITGYNDGEVTLQRNYYAACKVAGTPNASGVGCNNADVTANNGAVSIHTLTLAEGITTATAATVTIGTTGYYAQGTAIALSYSGTPGKGYQLGIVRIDGNGFTAAVADGDGHYTAVMPASNATATDHAPIDWATVSTGADKDNAYMIYNKDQLDLLAYRVNGTHGETRQDDGYEGKFFQLAKDISYTHTSDWDAFDSDESNFEAIGGYYGDDFRYFCGHFDGNNKTISGIRIYKDGNDDADNNQGIFGLTDSGAYIHDLTLADARITGYNYTGGIVGENNDGTVTRCHVAGDVAVCAVQSDAGNHGGIVGNNWGTIEQCTSAATLTIADADNSGCYGGIAGYNGGTLCDNLAIGATVPAAAYNSYGAITGHNNYGTLEHNYYANCEVANTPNATGVGCGYISDGNGGYTTADVTANNGAVSIHTLTLADGITTTTAATVTIGTTGYYAQGTAIALSYSGTPGEGYQLGIVRNDGNGFTAAVADGDGHYTAVMPAANATATDHAPIDWATVSTGADKDNAYMIYNKDQLDLLAYRVNGTHGETANDYKDTYFQLGKDITYTHTTDWDDAECEQESNYEAIGGYYDDGERYFRGHFDGNNKTISGIRIYKDGDGDADCYQGIFGQTGTGADIHDLTLADARITGYAFTGGIVGYNDGGTVSGCHVAADVAVCAVQSYAWYHGGIVGLNRGAIEQCTSAATLTTADADNSQYYGGIAGYNNKGTLSDNLAIGAIVPAAKKNSYGAITGGNGGEVTLQRNYYAACKVANTENATGVGCGNISDGNGGYTTADVTANNGAVCINTLALTANLAPDGNYWTTYYNSTLGFTIDDDENACAYTATYGGSQLTLHKLGKEIPKNTAVIIVADNDVVSMTAATALDDFSGTNDLLGVDDDTPISILDEFGTFYVLGMTTVGGNQHFGFHRYTGTEMAAHKAFVFVASSPSQSAARSLTMVFDDGNGSAGVSPATVADEDVRAPGWFTLDGRRLHAKPTAPGIYVNNGKKVVIK